MTGKLTIRIFAHSWVSDWNHGNAHFLRGLARNLKRLGHDVRCYEALGSWSLSNLVKHEGERAIDSIDHFRRSYPDLDIRFYNNDETFADFAARELRGADLVLIHEWNDPHVVNTILSLKKQLGFRALLHDTHHRAYTAPRDILRFHLYLFDGVLAFGEPLARIYADGFGVPGVWTFHEAADIDAFQPQPRAKELDALWIGNWGDEERSEELREFFIRPAAAVRGNAVAHGVRYPEQAVRELTEAGIEYRGYLPNLRAPEIYGRSRVAVHVPRRQYANGLSGIPTIRVFEALACGATLLCSPWSDVEGLFRPGDDFLVASSGAAMAAQMAWLLRDDAARAQLATNGLQTVRERHTCAHRAQQLISICEELA